jgi:hypothetical protein
MDIAPRPGQSNSPLEGQSSKVYCLQEYRVNVCARVFCVSRVCPGSPRCLFTGQVS